jgi:carboxyl-terminal processing protease
MRSPAPADPHSVFFDRNVPAIEKIRPPRRKGFGTVVSILPGRLVVLQTTPGPLGEIGNGAWRWNLAVNGYALDRLDMDQTSSSAVPPTAGAVISAAPDSL